MNQLGIDWRQGILTRANWQQLDDPIVGIPEPPNLQRGSGLVYSTARDLWQFPKQIFSKIWDLDFSNVTIAVLDTGYSPHPDLPKPIFEASMISGESVRDRHGHGTHCAGTALGRNGIGFAHNAKFICIKVLGNDGRGSSSGIARGIELALEKGADVISLSLGGSSPYEPTRQIGEKCAKAGVICVAAAGNAGQRSRDTDGWPARFDAYQSVGATRSDGRIAEFSSAGQSLDVACPGQGIISASHRGGYVSMSGTSMATPWYAGLCAAVVSLQRREGNERIRSADAWREMVRKYLADKGAPGRDRVYGDGVPRPWEWLKALIGEDEWA